jgi:hypothetical protein
MQRHTVGCRNEYRQPTFFQEGGKYVFLSTRRSKVLAASFWVTTPQIFQD